MILTLSTLLALTGRAVRGDESPPEGMTGVMDFSDPENSGYLALLEDI